MTKLKICIDCHKPSGEEKLNYAGRCDHCQRKIDKVPSSFDSDNWVKYLHELKDQEWTYKQSTCTQHYFNKLPRSGRYLGMPLWRCIYCEGVVQSM